MEWLAAYAAVVGTLAVVLQGLRTYWMWKERRRRTERALARVEARSGGHSVGTCRPGCISNCPGSSQGGKGMTSSMGPN